MSLVPLSPLGPPDPSIPDFSATRGSNCRRCICSCSGRAVCRSNSCRRPVRATQSAQEVDRNGRITPHPPRRGDGDGAMTKLAPWATRHSERLAAAKAVQAAVKSGRLVQSLVCESCGQLRARRRRLDAHHEDYSKPLSVHWLCQRCHQEHHNAVRLCLRVASGGALPALWVEVEAVRRVQASWRRESVAQNEPPSKSRRRLAPTPITQALSNADEAEGQRSR